jgi:hypothetical protein
MRRSSTLSLTGAALVLAGCASSATDRLLAPPEQARRGAEPHLASPVFFRAPLRPVVDPQTQLAYDGGGSVRLILGWSPPPHPERLIVPPGPCRSTSLLPAVQDGFVQVNVCALIDNPGGAALSGGGLASNNDPNQRGMLVAFGTRNLYPPGPCRTYVVVGAVAMDRDIAIALANRPGDFAALFEFQEVNERSGGEIRGDFGPPSGGPGEGSATGGLQGPGGGDPACVIDVTPIR